MHLPPVVIKYTPTTYGNYVRLPSVVITYHKKDDSLPSNTVKAFTMFIVRCKQQSFIIACARYISICYSRRSTQQQGWLHRDESITASCW